MDDQNKNLLLAVVLSFLVILTWFILFPPEDIVPPPAETVATAPASDVTPGTGTPALPGSEGGTGAGTDGEGAAALATAPRIVVRTPNLSGSISLLGGRIDDLALNNYRVTTEPDADTVHLLNPQGEIEAYYALFGYAAGDGLAAEAVPGRDTLWTLAQGNELTPESPITLTWDNGAGLLFRRTIAVDDRFMFTIDQSVINTTDAAVMLRPYGLISRHGQPSGLKKFFILHEGAVRMSDGTLEEASYSDLEKLEFDERESTRAGREEVQQNGWVGFTDHYWMTTLVPQQGTPFRSVIKYFEARDLYQVEAVMPMQTVEPGASATVRTQLFAGAKEWAAIRDYQNKSGIYGFLDSIDWGWFFFLTKPIFALLHTLNAFIGNMGWSIVVLTLVIKALVLPLAYKSYVSMAKMKELQPEMEKLKERAGEDKQALQQGMMKLYKDNKVNPASGCLPILIQIPIFFSLYKVIFVTLELRHAPWIGWINDLSAPDTSSILNLFGLAPWGTPEPGSLFFIFSLGVLPIILGISMWLQQKLNPAPTDPTQKMIFAWMPWVFMFMLGTFASGLVLYWIANNTITFTQQYAIMRSHGHKPDLFGNIISSFQRKPAVANTDKKPGAK
ncbi:MAG: membrane protein insertase YidC [Rhodobacterales bacterium]|nr:membrane protein insertase YidC [Rhodobacterales bacterium]NCT13632.1 membrane protein insertase YidC [Rhodobacterales bacterium]